LIPRLFYSAMVLEWGTISRHRFRDISMDFVLFIVVFIALWFVFYCKFSLLPMARLRQAVMSIAKTSEMTREYLLEIVDCAVAVIAAAVIASIAVWYVTLFQ
jgi:hypothetical protein